MSGAAATVGVGACVHAAAETVPLGQIMATRAGVSMVLIVIYGLIVAQARDLLPRRARPHLIRGGLACIAMALSYYAVARLPVTQATTLAYLAPILLVPMAIWRLGERPRLGTYLALAFGFAGVLLILGLSFAVGRAAFLGALAGVGAAVLIAGIQITVRAMSATETALSIALSFTVIVVLLAGLTAFTGTWVSLSGPPLYWLLGAGAFGALNLICFAESLARAPASTVAPMEYTGLVWALLADWVLFAQVPGPLGILGSVLITVAALLVVFTRARPVTAVHPVR
ncbi:MAG: DMT family transporter [Pseudomonadota bacterium]